MENYVHVDNNCKNQLVKKVWNSKQNINLICFYHNIGTLYMFQIKTCQIGSQSKQYFQYT